MRHNPMLSFCETAAGNARRRFGFTLAELLVVLVILGLAAAIVVPVLSNTGDLDTAAAARKITYDLLYAQNYAVTHQTRVQVSFNANADSYTLTELPDDGAAVVLTHPVTKRPYVVVFGPNGGLEKVDLTEAVFCGSANVTFDSLGAPNEGGSITLVSGEKSREVDVAPITGKVSVQ